MKTITQDERLKLMGIMALAKSHQKIVDQCYDAITDIVMEESSLIHDTVYEENFRMADFDKLLERAGIEVTE
jgi:hypothetical protein